MITLPKSRTAFFDVDGTLINHCNSEHPVGEETFFVQEPWRNGERVALNPHKSHIARLKTLKEAGWHIIVWSQASGEWCQAVVGGLGLDNYVDVCLSKPILFYDDFDALSFMGNMQRRHHDQLPELA